MMRRTWPELIEAAGKRYRWSERYEKREVLEEFVQKRAYQRKHAIRVLCLQARRPMRSARYHNQVRAARITLWESLPIGSATNDWRGSFQRRAIQWYSKFTWGYRSRLPTTKPDQQRCHWPAAAWRAEQVFAGQRRRAGAVSNVIRRAMHEVAVDLAAIAMLDKINLEIAE